MLYGFIFCGLLLTVAIAFVRWIASNDHPFNLAEFQDLWNCTSLAMHAPGIHKDNPTLLYAE